MLGSKVKIDWLDEWDLNLTYWVPAQMFRTFRHKEAVAKLCCHWRHCNPWFFFILGGDDITGDPCFVLGSGMSKTARFEDVRSRGIALLARYLDGLS